VGVEAEAKRVHKKLDILLTDCESFCYDFDDFNAQHSVSSMSAVLDAFAEHFKNDMSDDQVQVMEWVRASIFDVKIQDYETKNWYKSRGTLLSGWRLTTFMNTVLNYVYMKCSGALATPGVVDSVHNGDDVLVAVNTVSAVTNIMYKMNAINARAQATKCNFMAVGEFLRVEHKSKSKLEIGAQYLTRACATACHGRTESQEPTDALGLLQAHYTRLGELEQRCSVKKRITISKLREVLTSVTAKLFSIERKVLMRYAEGHKVVGGMLSDASGSVDWLIERRFTGPEVRDADEGNILREKENVGINDIMPGVYDYARSLCRQFKEVIELDAAITAVVRGSRAVLEVERKQVISISDVSCLKQHKYARALSGMLKGQLPLSNVGKMRFMGLPPVALIDSKGVQLVLTAVGDVKDPLRAISILC
jgi:hypothetical protein